jgi:hypothetical protein
MRAMKIKSPKYLLTLALAAAVLSVRAEDANMAPTTDASAAAPVVDSSAADSLKPEMDQDAWRFGLSVPLWAPKIDGNATVRGHQQNVSISFNDLRQHLDSIFSLGLDARKGKFDFYGDVGYMKFSADKFFPDGHINAWTGLKFLVSDAGVGYTLIKTESEHPFVLEGTAGVRYWYVSSPATLSDDMGNTLFEGSKTWDVVDPVIGLRGSQYLTRKFHLDFAGDGGGFNISHETDWTWSATGVLTYDFCRYFSLSAGYKALALDESEGSGSGKNGVNLIFNGALVTLNFHW